MLKNCIKAERKRRGISQKEMHERTGLSHTVISDVENGKKTEIKASTMKRIADALGVAPFDIFYWDDIPIL